LDPTKLPECVDTKATSAVRHCATFNRIPAAVHPRYIKKSDIHRLPSTVLPASRRRQRRRSDSLRYTPNLRAARNPYIHTGTTHPPIRLSDVHQRRPTFGRQLVCRDYVVLSAPNVTYSRNVHRLKSFETGLIRLRKINRQHRAVRSINLRS